MPSSQDLYLGSGIIHLIVVYFAYCLGFFTGISNIMCSELNFRSTLTQFLPHPQLSAVFQKACLCTQLYRSGPRVLPLNVPLSGPGVQSISECDLSAATVCRDSAQFHHQPLPHPTRQPSCLPALTLAMIFSLWEEKRTFRSFKY